jgi:hypothetical protein
VFSFGLLHPKMNVINKIIMIWIVVIKMVLTFGGMKRWGLRVIFFQVTQKLKRATEVLPIFRTTLVIS